MGIGEIYICKAIAETTGRSVSAIKSEISERGDLGIVAEHSKSNQRMMFQPAPLTVTKVFANLKEIALLSGHAVSLFSHYTYYVFDTTLLFFFLFIF